MKIAISGISEQTTSSSISSSSAPPQPLLHALTFLVPTPSKKPFLLLSLIGARAQSKFWMSSDISLKEVFAVTSECPKVLRPNLVILNLDLQFGSGHATSSSVDIQSFGCVSRCLAASSGKMEPTNKTTGHQLVTERREDCIYPTNRSKVLDRVANTTSPPQV
jgi:hypothetical protein